MTIKQYNFAKNMRIVSIVANVAALIFITVSIFTSDKSTLVNYLVIVIFIVTLINAIIHKPIPPENTQN